MVLPLDMVDNSTGLSRPISGRFFYDEAVQTSLLFPEQGSIRVLL